MQVSWHSGCKAKEKPLFVRTLFRKTAAKNIFHIIVGLSGRKNKGTPLFFERMLQKKLQNHGFYIVFGTSDAKKVENQCCFNHRVQNSCKHTAFVMRFCTLDFKQSKPNGSSVFLQTSTKNSVFNGLGQTNTRYVFNN